MRRLSCCCVRSDRVLQGLYDSFHLMLCGCILQCAQPRRRQMQAREAEGLSAEAADLNGRRMFRRASRGSRAGLALHNSKLWRSVSFRWCERTWWAGNRTRGRCPGGSWPSGLSRVRSVCLGDGGLRALMARGCHVARNLQNCAMKCLKCAARCRHSNTSGPCIPFRARGVGCSIRLQRPDRYNFA